jgi:hypothetical protein
MGNKTKPMKENEKAGEATAEARKTYALAMFKPQAGIEGVLAKAKRLTLPRMLLPKDFPIFTEENQAILIGTVVRATNSPASTVKGKCLWLTLKSGEEILLPVTGSIRQCLAEGVEANSKELMDALDKHKGKTFAFKRLDNTMNTKYKKEQFIFDVFELD